MQMSNVHLFRKRALIQTTQSNRVIGKHQEFITISFIAIFPLLCYVESCFILL